MVVNNKPHFKTRARIILQLGEQLIKSEAIALLELIKNSYDADASKCSVKIYHPDDEDNGRIIIQDDGEGMDFKILRDVWLGIGTDYKETLPNKRSPKFHRLRLGEKGIGRFGVHRLGREITIITRAYNKPEYILRVNWDRVDDSEFVEELPVSITKRTKAKTFINKTGTRIIIKRLRVPWNERMARDCARAIMSLNSPFESDDSFRVSFRIPGYSWLDGLLQFSEIEHYKLFSFDIWMSGNEITDFTYEFIPWETMKKLSPRKIDINELRERKLTRMAYTLNRKLVDIDLSKYHIGKVYFKGVVFDRDTRTLDLGVQDRLGFKNYLDTNGGVRVFRDNMRVLDYGEPGNDWLDMSGRRVNFPTKRISNNIIMAAVYLDHSKSTDLKEKANREGFVENEAYRELWQALRFAIGRVEEYRKRDKDLLRKHYGPQIAAEPVTTSISDLKSVVEEKVKNESVRNEIARYLDRIEKEYEFITESLIRSAGAGLNLILVIHQIEKILKETMAMLKRKVPSEIIEDKVQKLSNLVEGYSLLVRSSEKKMRNLKGIVNQSIFNIQFRLDAHNIKLDPAFQSRTKGLDAICSEAHVLNALMNLYDNSIWWLEYSRTKEPTIFIDISDQLPKYVCIVIADNGPGFTLPTEEIIKPFVSNKPDGMGIGLHLTHEIMESLGGKLIFPESGDFNIPKKYSKGAKIALAFKVEER